MRYEFATAQRILVGPGTRAELPTLAAKIGQRALLVVGRGIAARGGAAATLADTLASQGIVAEHFAVSGEPNVAIVESGAALARASGCDYVIGLGGGSVLDAAKAIAALAANSGGALDYMEVVGAGKPLQHAALPVIAVPTTAGTGSEVTRNAVIAAEAVKASIRHASLLPRLALVDSELTHELTPQLTATTGLDALTQLLEAFVSRRAQPISDGLCIEGLTRTAWALRHAYHQPNDAAAREAMATASLLSGLALANAGLGAVHGIAAPLGGAYPVAHGAACAALLPHVVAVNISALRQRDLNGPALQRYAQLAVLLVGRADATLDELVAWLGDLVAELGIPPLSACGLLPSGISDLARRAAHASSTRGNPIDLQADELEAAIGAAL